MAIRFEALGQIGSWMVEWGLVFGVLLGYQAALARFEVSRLRLARPLFGVVSAVVLVAMGASVASGLNVPAVFVPTALGALWVSASFGMGAGLVTALVSAVFCALSGVDQAITAPLLVRVVALVLICRVERGANESLRAGVLAGLISASVLISVSLGDEQPWPDLLFSASLHAAGGALEGALLALTRGFGERLLGHVSRERLVALLDLSQPLLKRMIERAPGSFEHSRAMANLAEQAASAIGADALLTRVGAYYHDLGKSVAPKFFVENLAHGERSAHDELTPLESAAHILKHVEQGVAILRDGGIPEPVVEFAYTHHGTQVVEYFLNKERARCEATRESVKEADFRYPGMKPTTRETAILMVVDSIEAASRTLDNPDRACLEQMVRRIVFTKLASEQLDESGLTMKELRVVCARVVETLVHMNHHRIKYPWQMERARQFGLGADELSSVEKMGPYPRAVAGA